MLECKDTFESKILLFLRIFFVNGNFKENFYSSTLRKIILKSNFSVDLFSDIFIFLKQKKFKYIPKFSILCIYVSMLHY